MTYVENIDDTWFEPFGKKKYYNNTIRKILKLVKKTSYPCNLIFKWLRQNDHQSTQMNIQ